MSQSLIKTNDITTDAVTNTKIINNAVDANKLQTDSVTNPKIQNDAVTTAKILDNNVTDAKINSVSGSKVTGAVALATTASNAPHSLSDTNFNFGIIEIPLTNPDFTGGSLTGWSTTGTTSGISAFLYSMGGALVGTTLGAASTISQTVSGTSVSSPLSTFTISRNLGINFLTYNVSGFSATYVTVVVGGNSVSVSNDGFGPFRYHFAVLPLGGSFNSDNIVVTAYGGNGTANGNQIAYTGFRLWWII